MASLERIGSALGMTIGDFFSKEAASGHPVVKAKDKVTVQSQWSRAVLEAIGPSDVDAEVEAILVTIKRGGMSGKRLHAQGREQLGVVVRGRVKLIIGDDHYVLSKGDSVRIRRDVPHRWINDGPKSVQLMVISRRWP
jgi:quercetin dioxygenase-like cupin family protein